MWSKFWYIDENIFSHDHMSVLAILAFMQQTTLLWSGMLDRLARWTCGFILVGFRNWSMWFFRYHWIGLQTPVLAPLRKAMLIIGQGTIFLSPKKQSIFGKLLILPRNLNCQGKSPLSAKSEPSTWRHHHRAHWSSQERHSFPSLQLWTKQTRWDWLSHHTTRQNPKIEIAWAYQPENSSWNIPVSFSVKITFLLMASIWCKLLTCIFRIVELKFPLLECLLWEWHRWPHAL